MGGGGTFKANCRARVSVNIQTSALLAPTVTLAWQWKPRGHRRRPTKEDTVFNARAICQFSLGPFQGSSGVKAGAEKGVCRGGYKNHSWGVGEQLQYEKNQRRVGAWVDEWGAFEGRSSWALNRFTAPSPMGFCWLPSSLHVIVRICY